MSRPGIALQGLSYGLAWAIHREVFSPPVRAGPAVELALAVLTIALAIASPWLSIAAVRRLG